MTSSVQVNRMFGANPHSERGLSTYMTADDKHDRFAYCAVDHIVIRKISDPETCQVYRGHKEPTCIKFSPNGMFACSGDAHGTIKVWNTENMGITRLEQQVLAGPIRDVAWSPDDQRLLVVGEGRGDYAVCIMVEGGSRIGKIDGFTAGCISCDFRPARPFKMAVISNDRSLAFWKGPPLKEEFHKEEPDILPRQIRYAPDGSYFISVGSGKCIIYDGTSGERAKELPVEHKGTITGATWSPDCKQVATSCCDNTVKVWDVESASCVATITYGDGTDMAFQQLGCVWAGDSVISVSLNGDLNFVKAQDGASPHRVLPGLMTGVEGLTLTDGGNVFAGSSLDKVCKVVSYNQGGAIASVMGQGPKQVITGMAACGDDVLTLSMDGALSVADGADPKAVTYSTRVEGLSLPTKGMAGRGDLAICLTGTTVTLHRKSKEYAVLSTLADLDYVPLACAISPDETEVAISCEEERGKPKKVVLYKVDGDALTAFKELREYRGAVYTLQYSPNGAYLATGDGNREVRVLDRAKDYECLREDLQFNGSRVTCLAWHPESEMLISGDIGRNLVVTNLTKLLQPTVVDRICEGSVHSVQFINSDVFVLGDTTGSVYMCDFKRL